MGRIVVTACVATAVLTLLTVHLDQQVEEGLLDELVQVRVDMLGSVVGRLERYHALAVVTQTAELERKAILRRSVLSNHSSYFFFPEIFNQIKKLQLLLKITWR
jgi:hypothetical protein